MLTTNEIYWEDSDLVHFDDMMLKSKGFDLASIEALSQMGLPEWVAPNMNFDFYEPNNQFLKIGEDRDDQSICVCFETMFVMLCPKGTFINSNPSLFRKTLKLYAAMVEDAILIDEDAVVENNIENDLIKTFQGNLSVLDKKAEDTDSFWSREINRLLNTTT